MTQDGSLDIRLVTRICHLQQALDQALDSLDELRSRVQEQSLLEFQLAETEKFASVQQQAIAQLQNQFEQHSQNQAQTLQGFVASNETWVHDQQLELERLRVRIQRSQTEIQTYLIRLKQKCQSDTPQPTWSSSEQRRLDLESEVFVARMLAVSLGSQLAAAWQHIQDLGTLLTRHQTALIQIKPHLEPKFPSPEDQSLEQTSSRARGSISAIASAQSGVNAQLQVDAQSNLRATQLRLAEVEAELTEQFKSQTRLKHRCQELAVERDHCKQKMHSLEQQNVDLQEQVLQQASQAKEYEAAVQYWKDLYMASH